MNLLLRAAFLTAALLCAPLFSAQAVGILNPGTYVADDHGFGNEGSAYGLRYDVLGEIFSVVLNNAEVLITWDGGNTATVNGTLNENSAGGAGGNGPIWTVEYMLTGVVAVGTQGFTATGGTGKLTDPANVMHTLTGKQDGSGFAAYFLADGHRIPGDDMTPVLRGWFDEDGTNDWLVRAELPEPGTALLMGAGLLGLALFGRRP